MTNTPTPHSATPEQFQLLQQTMGDLADRLAAAEQRISELQAAHNVETNWQSEQDDRLRITDERLANLENVENLRQQDEDAERAAEPSAPAGSLINRVAGAMADSDPGYGKEARAAIMAVADWLEQFEFVGAVHALRQKVERG